MHLSNPVGHPARACRHSRHATAASRLDVEFAARAVRGRVRSLRDRSRPPLFGLVDLGRVFYFDVGLTGATREAARHASWFVPPPSGSGAPGANPSLYDTDGWSQDPCPYEPGGNPTGDPNPNPGIKQSVDCNLNKYHLPSSILQNPITTYPAPTDGNTTYNQPYLDSTYPGAANQPLLYICYANTPGLDLATAPTDNSYKGLDVNVILVMNYGFAGGFLPDVVGTSLHIVANTHMVIGGY